MPIPNPITVEELKKRGARCEVERFKTTFPDGAELTLENCLKASKKEFKLYWFAKNFLNREQFEVYREGSAALWEACEAKIPNFWQAFEEKEVRTLLKALEEKEALLLWSIIKEEVK